MALRKRSTRASGRRFYGRSFLFVLMFIHVSAFVLSKNSARQLSKETQQEPRPVVPAPDIPEGDGTLLAQEAVRPQEVLSHVNKQEASQSDLLEILSAAPAVEVGGIAPVSLEGALSL